MSKEYFLTSECHIVSFPDEKDSLFLAYFPIQSLVLKINQLGVELLEKLKLEPVSLNKPSETEFLDHLVRIGLVNGSPEKRPIHHNFPEPRPVRTMLLVSDRCNLRCLYCYNNADEVGGLMSFNVAKAAIDFLINNAKRMQSKLIDLGFHGGGEPTTNWDVLTKAVE